MYGTTDPLAAIDAIGTPQGENGDDFKPAPGSYRVTISGAAFDKAKSSGELYVRVSFKLDTGEEWSDVRVLTKQGVAQEGRVKAAKVMMRMLGLNGDQPASTWKAQLEGLVGRAFFVDVVQNGEYLNTNVVGADNVTPTPAPAVAPAASPVAAPGGAFGDDSPF